MALLTTLKLVTANRNTKVSPIVQRRHKLGRKLFEQIELAKAQAEGRSYAPSKLKSLTNKETGERSVIEVAKRISPWWWVADNGKLNLCIRYGARMLEINKGLNAIEIEGADLVTTLELIAKAVEAGELDTAIERVSQFARPIKK